MLGKTHAADNLRKAGIPIVPRARQYQAAETARTIAYFRHHKTCANGLYFSCLGWLVGVPQTKTAIFASNLCHPPSSLFKNQCDYFVWCNLLVSEMSMHHAQPVNCANITEPLLPAVPVRNLV